MDLSLNQVTLLSLGIGMIAAAARLNCEGVNAVMIQENWPSAIGNDFVPIGILHYLGDGCVVEYGQKGQDDADKAIWRALEILEFWKIVNAHEASGRYHTCACGVT